MPGFRGPAYAGVAGADLENAPQGPVPFTSPMGLPVTRMVTWHASGVQPGTTTDGVPGQPVQYASGNPDVATVPKWGPPKSPYGGANGAGISQFGRARPLNPAQESAIRGPGGGPVGMANDDLIGYDRHAMMKVGYENSGRNSGMTDPPVQGPARPSLWLVQRTISYQQGTDTTANTDDLSRDYSRVSTQDAGAQSIGWIRNPHIGPYNGYSGREGQQYAGEQGTGWSPVYGGVPGLWQPYGSYAGVTNGPVEGLQSPVPLGQAGDGPQKIWSGPPHGLHSPTLPTYNQTLGRYLAIPQMRSPRVDRPSNSPIAGQSYSQTVQPQGQTGTVAQNTKINSGVNFNQRVGGNGWRGRGAG